MKKLLLASLGLALLAGCSEFTGTPSTTTTSTSTTMSGDSKDMVRTTTVNQAPPAELESTQADVSTNAIPYPAIHSNGQGAGQSY